MRNYLLYSLIYLLGVPIFFVEPVLAQTVDPIDHEHTIRCLTPIILEYEHNPESRAELGQILGVNSIQEWEKRKQNTAQIMNSDTTMSASGRFQLIYETSGQHAVPLSDADQNGIPDYVDWAAEYADSSWNHLVANLGFVDPVPDLKNPIKIRFQKITSYGFYQHNSRTITVHNNFTTSPFPTPNRDPEGNQKGALKVTIAHELKHAIQFSTINNPGSNWIEMDATMAEEVVYPNVKDYLNYVGIRRADGNHLDIFLNPARSAPFQYYHATFGFYYRERFGDQFWVDVWDRADSLNTTNMYQMMEQELIARGENPDDVFITMYLWHMASGQRWSVEGYGFKDKLLYPEIITTNSDLEKGLPYASAWKSLAQKSANYFDLLPEEIDNSETLYLGLLRHLGSTSRISLGIVFWMEDGTIDTQIIRSDDDFKRLGGQTSTRSILSFGFLGYKFPLDFQNIRRIGLVIVNPNTYNMSAQIIAGTSADPSTNRLAEFTSTSMSPDARTEAEALLDKLVLQSSVTQIDNPLELLTADVSANGRATPYDATMILQKGVGTLSAYPADPDNEVFVPRPSWYSLVDSPSSKTLDSDQISNVQNLRIASVFGDPKNPNSIDDTLRVYLISGTTVQFNSAHVEIEYDTTALFYNSFSAAFDPSATFIASRNNTISNRLRLAFASELPVQPSDTLVTLLFSPKIDTTVTLTLRHLQIDEIYSGIFNLFNTVEVRPSEGVSITRPSELPLTIKLDPAYPNPFNPSTVIPFEINELSFVTIDVFDMIGRRVASVVSEVYSAGRYNVPYYATSLASGVYIVQMTVTPQGNTGKTQRLVQRVTLLK